MKKTEWYFKPHNVIYLITLLFSSITIFYFGIAKSANNAMLGQYGDFLGGILNPLFSAISIIVLIVFVKDIEHQRALEAIKAQQLLAKTQMRFEVAKDLKNDLKNDSADGFKVKGLKIINGNTSVRAFVISNAFLFDNLITDKYREIVLIPFYTAIDNYIAFYQSWQSTNTINPETENELFRQYAFTKEIFLRSLDEYNIRQLDE